jgi:hypothetical protein
MRSERMAEVHGRGEKKGRVRKEGCYLTKVEAVECTATDCHFLQLQSVASKME